MALTACLGASSIGCGGGDGSNSGNPPVDTGVETEPDSTAIDTADTAVPDTGSPDTTIDDTSAETGTDSTVDTAPDVEDTGVDAADTTPDVEPDTTDSAPEDTTPADTTPADTAPVDTATCIIGGACNDGNACTTGEAYDSSCTCTGGTAVICNDSNVCTSDSCNTTTGCVFAPTGEGTSCGPGKKCNLGVCAELCTPGNVCNDSNACTTGEKFDDSCACTGGTTLTCDDSNPCTNDSCNASAGCVNTPATNGTPCGTGLQCIAGSCVDPATVLPTVSFTSPANNTNKSFPDKGPTKDVCNPLTFTISANAPLKIRTLSVHLFAPPNDGSGMTGAYCGVPAGTPLAPWRTGLGKPASAFKFDESKYAGLTSGTFTEHIAVSGLYMSVAPWLFCTQPGTSSTAFITQLNGSAFPAASTGGGYQTLSNDCFTTDGSATNATKQWTAIAWLRDEAGNEARAELKFWVYQQ